MIDSELLAFVGQIITAAVTNGSTVIGAVDVVQKDSPTQQGANSAPTAYFEKAYEIGRGAPIVKTVYDNETKVMTEKTTQLTETYIQISALAWQDPTASVVVTAGDIVQYINSYLRAPSVRAVFLASGLNVLKVAEVRNPWFENDRNQFEAMPNFDLTITHEKSITLVIGAITSATGDVINVDSAVSE